MRSRVLVGEQEVVRARLAGHVDAAGARLGDDGDAAAVLDVDDVERAARLLGDRDRAADRLELGRRRDAIRGSRGIACDPPRPRAGRETCVDRLVVLGVHGDGQPERGRALHPVVERAVVGLREVVDPAVAHERLEADHAALGELVEPVEVAGHEAAPEAKVDERRAARRRQP